MARARKPSNLISYTHSSPSGSFSSRRHFIGSTKPSLPGGSAARILSSESRCRGAAEFALVLRPLDEVFVLLVLRKLSNHFLQFLRLAFVGEHGDVVRLD